MKERNFFIFIVDRSGSMSGQKMETTNEALILFLKSLPSDSMFEIISFGSTFEHLSKDFKGFEYNDSNVYAAIEKVKTYTANLGGTEIYQPLEYAINEITAPTIFKKKIFLLTDGDVSQPDKVIELAKISSKGNSCNIHTFGIGQDCSVELVS